VLSDVCAVTREEKNTAHFSQKVPFFSFFAVTCFPHNTPRFPPVGRHGVTRTVCFSRAKNTQKHTKNTEKHTVFFCLCVTTHEEKHKGPNPLLSDVRTETTSKTVPSVPLPPCRDGSTGPKDPHFATFPTFVTHFCFCSHDVSRSLLSDVRAVTRDNNITRFA
jgi:hypothetical protein